MMYIRVQLYDNVIFFYSCTDWYVKKKPNKTHLYNDVMVIVF